jgi:hypothetical protein
MENEECTVDYFECVSEFLCATRCVVAGLQQHKELSLWFSMLQHHKQSSVLLNYCLSLHYCFLYETPLFI